MTSPMRTGADPRSDAELLALRDDDVIRRAQLWATGATVHNVNELIGSYRSATSVLDNPKRHSKRDRRFALEFMVWSLDALNDYMSHGDYGKARRAHPLPRIES